MTSFAEKSCTRRKQAERELRHALRAEAGRLVKLLRSEGFVVRRVYLWGSAVSDKPLSPWSDIDLVVEGLAPDLFFKAYAVLLRNADYPVDLKPLEEMDAQVQDRVRREGRVIYDQR